MLALLAIFIAIIVGARRHPPNREPQYRNEQIKQINFEDLERKWKNADRALVVRQKPYIEAARRAQALERDRQLAEAEAALREAELREAARRETERRLAEAVAWDALILPQATKDALQTYCELLINHQLSTGK